ncbi:hypothetical protein BM523_05000 [Alteromonas mediterranea]|uniref:hypothetical protein n=1 Tax=Alteromonas mediterranea TaxID=314275 RepID=UPI0009045B69|nr:hypothetical protein [Alteromonas mediterranea]APD93421.1 hypothetical protein BM523_05000 [Alteromonas mediterranea]APD97045.1 hypothetical protein BM525_05055 [Alteromonas mediterranea]QDG34157.1 hypothetical protein FJN13_04770 [Alteromonas mediterranea]QGX61116.1 hypothetical protein FJN15_04810 [Alteromonas mediterranea]
MKKAILVSLVAAFTISGCNSTSNSSSAEVASNEDDGMVCKMEKKVGSNMMRRVCYTPEEREMMENTAREAWTRMQRGTETSGGDL